MKENRRGRRPRIIAEPTLVASLSDALRAGHYVRVACAMCGVSPSSYYAWIARGEDAESRMLAGYELDETERAFVSFHTLLRQAEAESEATALATVRQAWSTTWQAAAWFLERRYPKRWARGNRPDEMPRAAAKNDPFADAVLHDPAARELSDRLLARVSEYEAEQRRSA